MERAYRELQASSGSSVGAQINSRLAAIENRKRIKAEFDAFLSVTSRTEQRDAELLSMQQSIAGKPINPVQVDLGRTPTSSPQFPGQPVPAYPHGANSPTRQQQTPQRPTQTSSPQMDGAGVVQRLPRPQPGLPEHALLTPEGRVLAYLQPGAGVQLDQYLGQSMGIVGRRSFDPRLRNDLIVVERLTPVQLQP